MSLNEFSDLIPMLREEVEKFCRGSQPSRDMLESLGWVLAARYHHPECSPLLDRKVVKFVIHYGEKDTLKKQQKGSLIMEMQKLMSLLDKAKIPYEVCDCHGTPQVCYPVGPAGSENCVCDVICHTYSYGGELGLLEVMGLVPENFSDTVQGWLTATDVFERIKAHWIKHSGKTRCVYDSTAGCYTNECNQKVDFIIRNLPGVTVIEEDHGLVQITADKKAMEVIEFLSDCDMVVLFKNATIEDLGLWD